MGNCSKAPRQDKKPDPEIFSRRKERKKRVRKLIKKDLYNVQPTWDKNCRTILKGSIFLAML